MSKAFSIGIPSDLVMHIPKGELEDLIDANLILNGYCDESVQDDFIDISLE